MRTLSAIFVLMLLPVRADADLMTFSLTGTANITFDGTTINGTTITVSMQIDQATADSLTGPNHGLFSGGTGTISLPDFGVVDAALANIDSVLLIDNGTERIGLVDSTRSEGLVLRNNASDVITDPNVLTGFIGPLVSTTTTFRLPLNLSDGRQVTAIDSPFGFVATAVPEPSSLALMATAGIAIFVRRRRRSVGTSRSVADLDR
jgi:hypothetical protein